MTPCPKDTHNHTHTHTHARTHRYHVGKHTYIGDPLPHEHRTHNQLKPEDAQGPDAALSEAQERMSEFTPEFTPDCAPMDVPGFVPEEDKKKVLREGVVWVWESMYGCGCGRRVWVWV